MIFKGRDVDAWDALGAFISAALGATFIKASPALPEPVYKGSKFADNFCRKFFM